MSVRVIAFVLVLGVGILAYVNWMKHPAATPAVAPQAQTPSGDAAPPPGMPGSAATPPAQAPNPGIHWKAPSRWQKQADRAMRVATYTIPKASGDSVDAECAVFYFGPGQGGGVGANLERWIGEFENAAPPRRFTAEVGGLKVSKVEVSGTYLAHGGHNMEALGRKPGWKLLGAIVESPAGPVFFKLTGPIKTVDAARTEFDGTVGSVRRK